MILAVTVVFLPYVDYQDASNLTSALRGVDIVVSTLVPPTPNVRQHLIDAALAAGMEQSISSEFGAGMEGSVNQAAPLWQSRIKTAEYLESLAQTSNTHPFLHIQQFSSGLSN